MQPRRGQAGGCAAVNRLRRHLHPVHIEARHRMGAVNRGADAIPLAQLHHAGRAADGPTVALVVRIEVDLPCGTHIKAEGLMAPVAGAADDGGPVVAKGIDAHHGFERDVAGQVERRRRVAQQLVAAIKIYRRLARHRACGPDRVTHLAGAQRDGLGHIADGAQLEAEVARGAGGAAAGVVLDDQRVLAGTAQDHGVAVGQVADAKHLGTGRVQQAPDRRRTREAQHVEKHLLAGVGVEAVDRRDQARVDAAVHHGVQRHHGGRPGVDEPEHVVAGGSAVAVHRDVVSTGGQGQQVAAVVRVAVVEGVAGGHRGAGERPAQVVTAGQAVEVQRARLGQGEAVVLRLARLADAPGHQAGGQAGHALDGAGSAAQNIRERRTCCFIQVVERDQAGVVADLRGGLERCHLYGGQRLIPDRQAVDRDLSAGVVVAVAVAADAQRIRQINPGHGVEVAHGHLRAVQHDANLRIDPVVHGGQLVPHPRRGQATGRLDVVVACAPARLCAHLNATVVVDENADLVLAGHRGFDDQRNPAVGRRPVDAEAGFQRVRAGLIGGRGVGKFEVLRVADLHAARVSTGLALRAHVQPGSDVQRLQRRRGDIEQLEAEVAGLVVVGVVAIDDQRVLARVRQREGVAVTQAGAAKHLATERVNQPPGRVEAAGTQALKVHRVACRGVELVQLRGVARAQKASDRLAIGKLLGTGQVDQPERIFTHVAAVAVDGEGVVTGPQADDAVGEVAQVLVERGAGAVDDQVVRVVAVGLGNAGQRIEIEQAGLRQAEVIHRLLAGLTDAASDDTRHAFEAVVNLAAQVAHRGICHAGTAGLVELEPSLEVGVCRVGGGGEITLNTGDIQGLVPQPELADRACKFAVAVVPTFVRIAEVQRGVLHARAAHVGAQRARGRLDAIDKNLHQTIAAVDHAGHVVPLAQMHRTGRCADIHLAIGIRGAQQQVAVGVEPQRISAALAITGVGPFVDHALPGLVDGIGPKAHLEADVLRQVERRVGANLDVVVPVQQHGGLGVVIGPLRRGGGDNGRVIGGREVNGRAEAEAVVNRGGPQGIEALDQQGVVAADGQRAFPVTPARIAHHLATEGVQQTPAQVAIAGAQGLEECALASRRLEAVGGRAAAGVERAVDRAAQGDRGGSHAQIQQTEGKVVSLLRRPEGDGVVAGHQVEHPGPLEAVVPAQVAVAEFDPVRSGHAPVRVVVGGGRLRVEVNRGVVRQREVEDRAAAARRQAEGLGAAQHQRCAHRQTRLRRVAVENELEAVVVRVGAEVFTRHHQGVAAGQAERQIGEVVEIPGGAHAPAERVQQHQAGAAGVGGNRVHIDVVAGHRVKGIHLDHVAGVQLAADHAARRDETGRRDVEQSQAEITHGGVVAANHQGVVARDQIDPACGVEAAVQVVPQRAIGQAGAKAVVGLALRAAERHQQRVVVGQGIENHAARGGHREAVDLDVAGGRNRAGQRQGGAGPEAAVDHRCDKMVQREGEGGVGWHAAAGVQQHGVAPAGTQRGQLGVVVVLAAQQLPGRVIHPEVAVRVLSPGQKQFLASLAVEGESHGLATRIEGARHRAVSRNRRGPRQIQQAHVIGAGGVTHAADIDPVVARDQV